MTNEELIQHMQKSGRLRSEKIAEAFRVVDRRDFVLPERKKEAYYDHPLPIGNDSTISQPSTVAFMLESLNPQEADNILEIGCGSGWVAALLAYLVGPDGRVCGVEIVPELVRTSKENLKKYNFDNLKIKKAKEDLGLSEYAPFDKIIVSAAAKKLPSELLRQLKVGGRIVIPIGASIWRIDKISDDEYEEEEFFGFAFVPLK